MLYVTRTMISSVDLAHYGVSRAKDWVSVDCGTKHGGNTLMCLSIGTPKNNEFFICSKWKIHYF